MKTLKLQLRSLPPLLVTPAMAVRPAAPPPDSPMLRRFARDLDPRSERIEAPLQRHGPQ